MEKENFVLNIRNEDIIFGKTGEIDLLFLLFIDV